MCSCMGHRNDVILRDPAHRNDVISRDPALLYPWSDFVLVFCGLGKLVDIFVMKNNFLTCILMLYLLIQWNWIQQVRPLGPRRNRWAACASRQSF